MADFGSSLTQHRLGILKPAMGSRQKAFSASSPIVSPARSSATANNTSPRSSSGAAFAPSLTALAVGRRVAVRIERGA